MARRTELTLVLILLVACVGTIGFVYTLLTKPGGAFEGKTAEEKPRTPPVLPPLPASPAPDPAAPPPGNGGSGGEAPAVDAPEAPEPPPAPEEADAPDLPPVEEEEESFAEDAALLDIEMVAPLEEEDRTLRIAVRDVQGYPVQDALVVFREGSLMLYRERTDREGNAYFRPYPGEKGPFRVDAVAHGFMPATADAVAAGVDTELVLEARPWVEGRVRAPADGGVVKLWTGERELRRKIKADGTFLFEELDPGYVTVQAEVEPYGADTESFYLEAGTRRFVTLHVREGGITPIYGTIGSWPGTGSAWINGSPAEVKPTGNYSFDKAVIGVNEILVDAPGRALVRERFSVKALVKSRYDFRLVRDAAIRGRVREARTGRPVADAEVRIGFDKGNPRNEPGLLFPISRGPVVKTDRDGRFEVERLDRRLLYLVSVVAPGYGQALQPVVPDGGFVGVDLPEGPFLFGKLRALGGLPRDAVVTARPLEGAAESRVFNVEAFDHAKSGRDRKGFYGLSGLLPVAYLVRVDAPRFGSLETVVDLADGRRVRLDVRLRRGGEVDADETELLRRLPPALNEPEPAPAETTMLAIDVTRPLDQPPFAAVRVLFFSREEEFAPPMEFLESAFEIVGLPEANYRAILQHGSLKKPMVREGILLRRGKPYRIEMR